jgi:hypothetical protein
MKYVNWKIIGLTVIALGGALLTPPSYGGDLKRGGAHGGGGSLRPMHPIRQSELSPLIEKEKWETALYFNQIEIDWRKSNRGVCPNGLCKKLFDGQITVFDVLSKVSVEYSESDRCRAPDGTYHDGAAPGSTENSICLSPFSMAPQLDRMAARAQSLALFAHEVSHLVGTTEKEADRLQDEAIIAFYSRRSEELNGRVNFAKERIANGLNIISKQLEVSDADLWNQARMSVDANHQPTFFGPGIPSYFWDVFSQYLDPDTDLDKDLIMPFLSWNSIALADEGLWVGEMVNGLPNETNALAKYKQIFGGSDVLPFTQFRTRLLKGTPAAKTYGLPLSQTPIYRVQDGASLRANLQVIKRIFEMLQEHLESYNAPPESP